MTTFTSDDREEAYKKILEEAPNQPGYEDAVPIPPTEEIKALEKGLEFYKALKGDNASPPHIVDSGASVMNNEPVAWIDPYDLERLPLNDCWVNGEKSKWADVPLYTHPAKTLTDEEIRAEWYNNCGKDDWFMEFAKAILKKASEK
jgi:hypothetical protein